MSLSCTADPPPIFLPFFIRHMPYVYKMTLNGMQLSAQYSTAVEPNISCTTGSPTNMLFTTHIESSVTGPFSSFRCMSRTDAMAITYMRIITRESTSITCPSPAPEMSCGPEITESRMEQVRNRFITSELSPLANAPPNTPRRAPT